MPALQFCKTVVRPSLSLDLSSLMDRRILGSREAFRQKRPAKLKEKENYISTHISNRP